MTKAELTNIDVTLYALLRLSGHMRKVHTEEIAYEAYNLAKERFGWRMQKFRDKGFPDKEPVRIALMDAAKKKYGCLVEGRAGVEAGGKDTDGWMFTPAGALWIRNNEERIKDALNIIRPKTSQRETSHFLNQIRSQPLFRKYIQNGSLITESQYALTDMLNTSPDAPKEVITLKFNRLRSTAELVGDQDIMRFLKACAERFSHLLEDAYQADLAEGD